MLMPVPHQHLSCGLRAPGGGQEQCQSRHRHLPWALTSIPHAGPMYVSSGIRSPGAADPEQHPVFGCGTPGDIVVAPGTVYWTSAWG